MRIRFFDRGLAEIVNIMSIFKNEFTISHFGGRKFFMNPTHTLDEYLDLVDENDNVVGKKKRSEVYAENLSNFRVVNAFVVNSKGEIWIPRRAANKRIFPLCLDMSMGGHVESGESYEDTLKRETQEELNIDTDRVQVRLLGHLSPQKDGVSANMNVYEIKMDKDRITTKAIS